MTSCKSSDFFIARAKLPRRFKLNDVIKNCFYPLNARTLIIYNVTLPYIPERNDKTSRNVARFHDVSIGEYIYCINCQFVFLHIYNSFIKVCKKRQKCRFGVLMMNDKNCRFGAEGLKNLYIMEWSYHPLLEDKVNIHTKKEELNKKCFFNFFCKCTHMQMY
jgi:hypothetical protein